MSPDEMLSVNVQNRLLKLENLFDAIRNSSEQCKEVLYSSLDSINSEFKSIKSLLPAFDTGLSSLQSQITGFNQLLGRNVSELSEKINTNLKEIGKVQESVNLCHANSIGAKLILNSHEEKIEKCESNQRKLVLIDESQHELSEELKKEINNLHSVCDSLYDNIMSLAAKQGESVKKHVEYEAKIKKLEEGISELKSDITRIVSQFTNHVEIKVSDLKAYVDQKLAALPKPVEKPSYDPAQEILSELQGLRLDVQNAVLKNNNLDTQYKMQDKRIENLVLNLQKLQLGK